MRNHNHLLGQVEGVDGIKTGYTRDSGFNLVTSVRRGARHIVAVVLGGRSATQPRRADARPDRRTHRRSLDQDADRAGRGGSQAGSATGTDQKPACRTRRGVPPRANEATAAIVPGSNAPITPVKVKTVTVKLVPPRNAPRAAKPNRSR